MAHVEEAVFKQLNADAALIASVAGRIFPPPAPQASSFPLITYEEISAVDMNSHDTVLPVTLHRISVIVWSDTEALSSGTRTIAEEIRAAMLGFAQSFRLNSLHRWHPDLRKFGIRQDFQVRNP